MNPDLEKNILPTGMLKILRRDIRWSFSAHNIRTPDKSAYFIFSSYFLAKTFVVGTQKNRLIERVLLSTKTHS